MSKYISVYMRPFKAIQPVHRHHHQHIFKITSIIKTFLPVFRITLQTEGTIIQEADSNAQDYYK